MFLSHILIQGSVSTELFLFLIKIPMWEPQIKDWGNLNTKALSIIFLQSKERFEAHASTSEEITKRTQVLIFSIFAFLGAFVSFKPQIVLSPILSIICCLLLLMALTFIVLLLSPRSDTILRGSPPKEILTDDFDCDKWLKEEQENLIYYREVVRYQEKIEIIKNSIRCRSLYFKIALGSALLLLILLSLHVVTSISPHL